jgi:hypothetical protein
MWLPSNHRYPCQNAAALRPAAALLQGSDDDLAWPLPTVQSGESNGDWLDDTDHAVEDLDGDRGLAALSIV